MRRFTEEEIKTLSKWEKHFRTAVLSNYKRATVRADDAKISEIYENATGEKINKNFGCGICSLNFYKKVGNKYFEDKSFYEQEEEKAGDEVVSMVLEIAGIKETTTPTKKTQNKGKRSPNKKNKKE